MSAAHATPAPLHLLVLCLMLVLSGVTSAQERLSNVLAPLQGTTLNEHPFMQDQPASAEHLAERIFKQLAACNWNPATLTRVQVREAPGCWASYQIN